MISILIPTRGRPQNMKRVVESARDNAVGEIEFVFYIDDDDQPSLAMAMKLDVSYVSGERIILSQMWNEAYKFAAGDILMHAGDDLIFRTERWDKLVTDVFDQYPDKILFAYGRDGYSPDHFGTHGFLHRNWANAVGYFVPPYFSSDFNDTWLNDVSTMIGRHVFIPELYTEHMHPVAGKGEWDTTHQERLARHEKDNVAQIYLDKLPEREADAKKLRKAMSGA